jgi:hypothetical protein
MYKGDDYNAALKAYKTTCRQIEKSRVNLSNAPAAGFKGKMDEPDANLGFVSSEFKLNSKDEVYTTFCAGVELINTTFDQWEVHLNLYSKKDDDKDD